MKPIDQYSVQILSQTGQVLRVSKNLRGLRDYARVSRVAEVVTKRDPSNRVRGLLAVVYSDGAHSTASFASFHIMIDFVRNRRTWRDAKTNHLDGDVGYLTTPGVIAGGAQ